jgi:uncharacterized protein YjbJ (UPF0337 family)
VGKNPDELRREIEQTRDALGQDVDALTEKVSPRRAVGRRVGRTRDRLIRVRYRVMGSPGAHARSGISGTAAGTAETVRSTAGQAADRTRSTAHSAADTASEKAQQATEAARQAPSAVLEQVEGNPMAAGLIAFGIGWLAATVLPASDAEGQLAGAAMERAEPVRDALRESATEVKERMTEPAQQAVGTVRERAGEAASQVREQASEQTGATGAT